MPPNLLTQLMFQNPAWKQEFDDTLVAIRDGAYSRLPERVDYVCAQIRHAIIADPNRSDPDIALFDADCLDVKQRVVARMAYIRTVLGR